MPKNKSTTTPSSQTQSLSLKLPPNIKRIASTLSLIVIIIALPLLTQPIISKSSAQPASPQPTLRQADLTLSPPPPIPISSQSLAPPSLTSKAVIVIDANSGSILYQKNPDQPLLPASTTKIMTALVALDTYPLDHVITITKEDRTIGNTMNLVSGEQISVENLLYGTLVASGNDAALALALSYPSGGYQGFIKAMNRKATELKLKSTSFKNVSGVETPGHLSSARDLAILTKHALSDPVFKQMVATARITVKSSDQKITHHLTTTNQLLGKVDGVTGVKTGWTENALECLVTTADRDNHQIITVVLGSSDRFGESTQLIDWTYQNHTWINLDSLFDPLAHRT